MNELDELAAAKARLRAICTLRKGKLEVKSLQEYHELIDRKSLFKGN